MESIVFFLGLPVLLELGLTSAVDTTALSSLTGSDVASGAVASFLVSSVFISVLDLSRSSRRFSCSFLFSDFSDFFFDSFSSDEYSFFFVFELENIYSNISKQD